MSEGLSEEERLGRLEGIQQHLQLLEEIGGPFLQLPNLFERDPAVDEPFVLSNSFLPERIGGSVRIVRREDDGNVYESLSTENLNHMLGSFLPGGYKERWEDFDLWQGTWDFVHERPGTADIAPMFEFGERVRLEDLLGDDAGEYVLLDVDIEDVVVYVPSTLYVEHLPRDAEYYWSVDYQTVFAARDPVGRTLSLGRSDPTTNYLWFRHLRSEPTEDREPLDGPNDVLVQYAYEPEVEFLRCYYTSLLTLYEKENHETLSRTIDYVHGPDDARAFVASSEQSQLLLFDVDRQTVRERVERVLAERPSIRRDLQFAKAYRDIWDTLFFERGELENVFEVGPFVDHLRAVDYQCRRHDDVPADSVFEADLDTIRDQLAGLLEPGDGFEQGALCMMGYEPVGRSDVLDIIDAELSDDDRDAVASILASCADESELLAFGEEVLVHSVEHALSTWTTDESLAGGSFELWYDVNFQGRDDDHARIGIYDSIQGGAGIADEVDDYLAEQDAIDLDGGVAAQSACHTAAADRTVIDLLSGADGDALYELYRDTAGWGIGSGADGDDGNQGDGGEGSKAGDDGPTGFQARLVDSRDDVVDDQRESYSLTDLTSHVENRVQALFETREAARFNAYLADEHATVEAQIERTPTAVDLMLHLHQHIFRDPRVRDTYRRFAEDEMGRDLSELGERLEEIAVQCRTACPDCLEVDGSDCIHGMKYQARMLNRRLLREVCADAA
jgi:hypothetical protein